MALWRRTPGGGGRIPIVTPERVVRGWSGPNGMKIRMMADGEADRWLGLLELAGVENGGDLVAAARAGRLGWLLSAGLSQGREAVRGRFIEALLAGDAEAAVHAVEGMSEAAMSVKPLIGGVPRGRGCRRVGSPGA